MVAEKDAFITELKALIEKLEGQVQDYRRTKFGPKSEKLDPAQLELALEDLETAIAETAGADRRGRGEDRSQRDRSAEDSKPRAAAQGARLAGTPAARRACDRARQHRLPLRLRRHGPDR